MPSGCQWSQAEQLRSKLAAFKDRGGCGDVLLNLGFEGFEGGELLFMTEHRNKSDFDLLSVDVLIEVKKVNFEDAFALGLDGGANTNVGNS